MLRADGVLHPAVGVLGPGAQLGQLRLPLRLGAPAHELAARVAPRGVRTLGAVRPRRLAARDSLELVDRLVGGEAGLLGRGRRALHERLGALGAHAAAAVPGRGEARRLGVVERGLRLGHGEHGLAHDHLLRVVLEARLHLGRGQPREVVGVLGRSVLAALLVDLLQPPLLDGEDADLVHDALQPLLARAERGAQRRLVERLRLEQPRARLLGAPRDLGAPAAARARARRLDLEERVAPRVDDSLRRDDLAARPVRQAAPLLAGAGGRKVDALELRLLRGAQRAVRRVLRDGPRVGLERVRLLRRQRVLLREGGPLALEVLLAHLVGVRLRVRVRVWVRVRVRVRVWEG